MCGRGSEDAKTVIHAEYQQILLWGERFKEYEL